MNNKKYLFIPVFDDDLEDILIVNAQNKENAIKIFSSYMAKKDISFIEDVHEKSINLCFAEKFWITNKQQSEEFCRTGNHPTSDDEFKNNVKKYFYDKPQYAELYLNHYFMELEKVKDDFRFPEDMLSYIYFKEFDELDWKIKIIENIPSL